MSNLPVGVGHGSILLRLMQIGNNLRDKGSRQLTDDHLSVGQVPLRIANGAGFSYRDVSALALGARVEPSEGGAAAVHALFFAVIPAGIFADVAFNHKPHPPVL